MGEGAGNMHILGKKSGRRTRALLSGSGGGKKKPEKKQHEGGKKKEGRGVNDWDDTPRMPLFLCGKKRN